MGLFRWIYCIETSAYIPSFLLESISSFFICTDILRKHFLKCLMRCRPNERSIFNCKLNLNLLWFFRESAQPTSSDSFQYHARLGQRTCMMWQVLWPQLLINRNIPAPNCSLRLKCGFRTSRCQTACLSARNAASRYPDAESFRLGNIMDPFQSNLSAKKFEKFQSSRSVSDFPVP